MLMLGGCALALAYNDSCVGSRIDSNGTSDGYLYPVQLNNMIQALELDENTNFISGSMQVQIGRAILQAKLPVPTLSVDHNCYNHEYNSGYAKDFNEHINKLTQLLSFNQVDASQIIVSRVNKKKEATNKNISSSSSEVKTQNNINQTSPAVKTDNSYLQLALQHPALLAASIGLLVAAAIVATVISCGATAAIGGAIGLAASATGAGLCTGGVTFFLTNKATTNIDIENDSNSHNFAHTVI